MNILTIAFKIILAIIFVLIGIMKITQPIKKLGETLGWINDYSPIFVRLLGVVELIIGLFLILPLIMKTIPKIFSSYSAIAIIIIMLGACVVHFQRGEYTMIISNLIILLMAGFIAYRNFL